MATRKFKISYVACMICLLALNWKCHCQIVVQHEPKHRILYVHFQGYVLFIPGVVFKSMCHDKDIDFGRTQT